MRLIWSEKSWEDYLYWQTHDKKILKKINTLIKDIKREPFDGLGKPEPLRYELAGCWSRSGFIEDDDLWIGEYEPCNGKSLTLST